MIEHILDLLYPRTCGFCDIINKNYLCAKCYNRLKHIDNTKVYKCKSNYINYHGYIFKYADLIRDKIIDYKFNEKAYLHKTFCYLILKNENICRYIKSYDIIIPVPIHKDRKKQRGYDQTKLLAKEVAKNLKIEIRNDILKKNINIAPQSTLNAIQRMENIKGAYNINKTEELTGKRILLMDDIYTTGSTLEECAKTISIINAKEISAFTLAKD